MRKPLYKVLDPVYLALDKKYIRRTRNLRLIPAERHRRGGKYSYVEWGHVIGIFQTLFFRHLEHKQNNQILDIGCGTGLLGIASEPFLGEEGHYTGIDVRRDDIEFCRRRFPATHFSFLHLEAANPAYNPGPAAARNRWGVKTGAFDLVSALSVWTHFGEEDALFYFRETARALRPGGRAVVTFFVLDEAYRSSLPRSAGPAKFHNTSPRKWVFDQPVNGSDAWFCPAWAAVPEQAIGVTEDGLARLQRETSLRVISRYPGNWKEVPGPFFQDILVFEKG